MIPLLTSAQQKASDAYTMVAEPIESIDLMERAARGMVRALLEHTEPFTEVFIFCGMGNNGGDGLAIGRLLNERGFKVTVLQVNHRPQGSPEWQEQTNRYLNAGGHLIPWDEGMIIENLNSDSLWIDALLGTGFNGEVEGLCARAITWLNSIKARIISVDIPSGLTATWPIGDGPKVKATQTLAVAYPKPSFFFPESADYVGKWCCIPIGSQFPEAVKPTNWLVEQSDILNLIPLRKQTAHKGNFGHAFLWAGSEGMWGAGVLAAQGALGSAAGKVSLRTTTEMALAIAPYFPEVMTFTSTNFPIPSPYTAAGFGPGLGRNLIDLGCVEWLIMEHTVPLVIDADAIHWLAAHPTWLPFLKNRAIITPHLGEAKAITACDGSWTEVLVALTTWCNEYGIFALLKGHHSCLISPDGNWTFNNTGNAWMARGGSGDVLTGIITGFLAQGMPLHDAAISAMWIHGKVGENMPPGESWASELWRLIKQRVEGK